MVNVVNASELTLSEVVDRLGLQIHFEDDFETCLTLQSLTQSEAAQIATLRQNWQRYYFQGKISENHVKVVALSPLLWMAGYLSDPALKILMEEAIEEIEIEDGEAVIRGRMDLLVGRHIESDRAVLSVLVVEAKNSAVQATIGLPQLLTYMETQLGQQDFIWGLVTNGLNYVFVRLEPGVCRQFPSLSILTAAEAERLLAATIAIRHGS